MKNIRKLEIEKIYEIRWLDHFSTENRSPRYAVIHPQTIMTSYGKYVAANADYIILAWCWAENDLEDNDNIHILKKGIVSIREVK